MLKVSGFVGETVAVLGLGRSGMAAGRALAAGGANVLCWDDNETTAAGATREGLRLADLNKSEVWDKENIVKLIVSPGIPHLYPAPSPVVQKAWQYGAQVDNDVGLFLAEVRKRQATAKLVAITGSNGKSTTTMLVHHILQHAGIASQVGGNIGRGVLDLDPQIEDDAGIYVLELSSYQTELAGCLEVDVAVFLNFSPDHYDRHGGSGGYFAAKARLFDNAEYCIIGVDQNEGRFLASRTAAPVKIISSQTANAMMPDNIRTLAGEHNKKNAQAAWEVCKYLGLGDAQILSGMHGFKALPHRMEEIAQLGNVVFINDSKATNIDSTVNALGAFDNIFLIAGGKSKEGGMEQLRTGFNNIAKAYLIGEAAADIAALLEEGGRPYVIAETLDNAVRLATKDAMTSNAPSPTVLLSPACASFDQFTDFEDRGDKFRRLVRERIKQE
jgi:UDP-N-acetylmuramoylalanine--D-glutamate ligase